MILDFRLPILDCGEKQVHKKYRIQLSCSDNRKSKIENRKWLRLSVFAFALVVAGDVAQAQQPAKIPRIGFLISSSPSAMAPRMEAFRQGLRELGYIE
jgi:hypothetical protein